MRGSRQYTSRDSFIWGVLSNSFVIVPEKAVPKNHSFCDKKKTFKTDFLIYWLRTESFKKQTKQSTSKNCISLPRGPLAGARAPTAIKESTIVDKTTSLTFNRPTIKDNCCNIITVKNVYWILTRAPRYSTVYFIIFSGS